MSLYSNIILLKHHVNWSHPWIFDFEHSINSWDQRLSTSLHDELGHVWKNINQVILFILSDCLYNEFSVFSEKEETTTFSTASVGLVAIGFEYLHLVKLGFYWFHYVKFTYLINGSDESEDSWCIALDLNININIFLLSSFFIYEFLFNFGRIARLTAIITKNWVNI